MKNILCISSNNFFNHLMQMKVTEYGHRCVVSTSIEEGLSFVHLNEIDLIIFQSKFGSYRKLLKHMSILSPKTKVIFGTFIGSQDYVELKSQNYPFFTFPFQDKEMIYTLKNVLEG